MEVSPGGGSKPSPRFFTIGGTRFRGPLGRGAGVNTGVSWPAVSWSWLTAPCRGYAGPERRSEIEQSPDPRRANARTGEDGRALR